CDRLGGRAPGGAVVRGVDGRRLVRRLPGGLGVGGQGTPFRFGSGQCRTTLVTSSGAVSARAGGRATGPTGTAGHAPRRSGPLWWRWLRGSSRDAVRCARGETHVTRGRPTDWGRPRGACRPRPQQLDTAPTVREPSRTAAHQRSPAPCPPPGEDVLRGSASSFPR